MTPELFFIALLPSIVLSCAVLMLLDGNPFNRPYVPVLTFSAINGAVESSADVLDPFGLNSLATSLMSDIDPAGSAPSSAPMLDADDYDGDNGFDPFDARELVHVFGRVHVPFWVETPDGVFEVHAVDMRYAFDRVELTGFNGTVTCTLDGSTQVELVGPVTVLDAPDEVIAYVGDGELLCADHGALFDIGVSDGAVSPIFENLDAVEYCSHFDGDGPHGHSFCGSCGSDVEVNSPLSTCSNCSTHAVYVDDTGWQYVEDHADLPPCAVTRFADIMFPAYVECALWSTSVTRTSDESEEPVPLDSWADESDIHADTFEEMRADVFRFVAEVWADVESMDAAQVGHDFWLTRERHGAGFWDRGLGDVGDRLTAAAHAYGGFDLYVGDDGRIYS